MAYSYYSSLHLRPTSTLPISKSYPSSSSSSCRAAISLPAIPICLPKIPTLTTAPSAAPPVFTLPSSTTHKDNLLSTIPTTSTDTAAAATTQLLYNAVLEAIADRIEMHNNVGIQRDNWNSLLLNSINMSILAATTITAASAAAGGDSSHLPSAIGSTILFSAATGLLMLMNAIQPSQLAEEQRNATRLFKQLQSQLLQTKPVGPISESDVEDAVEKVLALDRAYPLPLLGGKMIPKFPAQFQPAVWWPKRQSSTTTSTRTSTTSSRINSTGTTNGWTKELETDMRQVLGVVRDQDKEDYMKLGSMVLKLNKALAVAGPALTGIAAVASAVGLASVAVGAGAMAAAVNTLEHGGQIGMVVEMYRNCAGFFDHMEESIEASVDESDVEKRESGRVLEMKVALALGRSPSKLRELASKCSYSQDEGTPLDEFASKLF